MKRKFKILLSVIRHPLIIFSLRKVIVTLRKLGISAWDEDGNIKCVEQLFIEIAMTRFSELTSIDRFTEIVQQISTLD